eukprot:12742288-Prorocentrum_lima.AAC.1
MRNAGPSLDIGHSPAEVGPRLGQDSLQRPGSAMSPCRGSLAGDGSDGVMVRKPSPPDRRGGCVGIAAAVSCHQVKLAMDLGALVGRSWSVQERD